MRQPLASTPHLLRPQRRASKGRRSTKAQGVLRPRVWRGPANPQLRLSLCMRATGGTHRTRGWSLHARHRSTPGSSVR